MLTWLRLQDFKSFVDEEVKLSPLTVLLGANAAGKSNLLDAIRFLQGLAAGFTVEEALDGAASGGVNTWTGIRGGAAGAARDGTSAFTLSSRWLVDGVELEHSIRCELGGLSVVEGVAAESPSPFIASESLVRVGPREVLFSASGAPPRSALSRPSLRPSVLNARSEYAYAPNHSLLTELLLEPDLPPGVLLQARALRDRMRETTWSRIDLNAVRGYARRRATRLGEDGTGFAAVLQRLCRDDTVRRDLVGYLSELCAPSVSGIEFVDTHLDDVSFALLEASGARVPARSLSDGTLHLLATLVAFLEAPAGAPLLLEEIERGLHPARVGLMVEAMERTLLPECQFIVTTHSPYVLAALSPQRLNDAVILGRPALAAGTVMRRLGDLPHFAEVATRNGIEELFTTRWLERALP